MNAAASSDLRALGALLRRGARALRNTGRVVRAQSRLKVAFVALFSFGMLAGLFAVFAEGFRFLDALGGVGLLLVYRLLGFFFWGLGAMMVVSGFVTSFATLFRSPETAHLLARPVPRSELALYKFLESALLSSWAYFFIVIPFMAAFAWHERMNPLFSVWTLLFSVPFVLIASGVGLLACLLAVRWLPNRRGIVFLPLAAFAAAMAWAVLRPVAGADADAAGGDAFFVGRLVPGLRLASQPWWPSWWLAEGIGAMVRGQVARGLALWGVLCANAAFVALLVEAAGRRHLYEAWLRAQSPAAGRLRARPILSRLPAWGRPDLRALVAKDLRLFFRDPVQWNQGLVFFALLGFYFLNLRNFRYDQLDPVWRNLVAFLNVFSIASVLCSFGSRFVYPQLSLEGQAAWVLGLSPGGMRRALAVKFGVAWLSLLAISVGLTALSAAMLRIGPAAAATALLLAAALATAVSGLSVGLGAVFMDLRQQNPAAIVSGFGGTLNLILNLAVMLATILPLGFLFHAREAVPIGPGEFRAWLTAGVAWTLGLCGAAALAPMALARRALRDREY
jgi:ABC-2 type transport system permease protein